jgi:hypothetical protein
LEEIKTFSLDFSLWIFLFIQSSNLKGTNLPSLSIVWYYKSISFTHFDSDGEESTFSCMH